MMNETCLICREKAVRQLLDLGPQPISNRFPKRAEDDRERHSLRFGCCGNCGLGQLVDPPPPELLRPRADWIRYNEPEAHLDDLVDRLVKLDGIDPESGFVGLTYKEESTLRRLEERGYRNTSRFDWEIADPRAGLETLQAKLTAEWAAARAREGRASVVIARHVLEHAQNPREAATALRNLVEPGGYLVLEVPDNTRVLANREYCFLWEEHVTYFTPVSLRRSLGELGFEIAWMNSYDYPVEPALVAVVRRDSGQGASGAIDASSRPEAFDAAEAFGSDFESQRSRVQATLARLAEQQGPVALFGAGHLACKFVNFHGIAPWIEFVVDDHPQKQEAMLPGSRLAIRPASDLADAGIRLILLSVNPESESKVIAKYGPSCPPDARFASIFRSSARAF